MGAKQGTCLGQVFDSLFIFFRLLRGVAHNGDAAVRLLLQVDAALVLVGAGPASRARIFALGHRARARPAADARVTFVVQAVVGQVVRADVVPDLVVRPGGQRV